MVVIYDSVLTEPPSSVHCFRDVTLYANVFLEAENLIRCPKGTRSMYWHWIKKYGAHDFVEEILTYEEAQEGIKVGESQGLNYKYLNENNISQLINQLSLLAI